jgi:hypothetical protein
MSRIAGPLGGGHPDERPDDGTLARLRTPTPGPARRDAKAAGEKSLGLHDRHSRSPRRKSAPAIHRFGPRGAAVRMPQFKQGGSGPSIKKIQTLLNARSSAGLVVDGMFGPRTREAVIAYQRAVHLRPDGIVGIQTLASLAFADPKKPLTLGRPVEFGSSAPGAAPRPGAASAPGAGLSPGARPVPAPLITAASRRPVNIHEWPTKDIIIEVLKRTGDKLGPDLHAQWNQLISPASLEMMAGTIVLVLAAHAVGIGEVADAVMLGIGIFYLGSGAIDGAKELGGFLATVAQAATPQDLDRAADHLAKAIVILGITAVMAWLLKRSLKAAGGQAAEARVAAETGGAAETSVAESSAKATQERPPALDPKAEAAESKPPKPRLAGGPQGRPKLPANPDELLDQGYVETSDPRAAAAGRRTFENPETGDRLDFDKGEPGADGFRGDDHYHQTNNNATGKGNQYLDKSGNSVPRGSKASHLLPGD